MRNHLQVQTLFMIAIGAFVGYLAATTGSLATAHGDAAANGPVAQCGLEDFRCCATHDDDVLALADAGTAVPVVAAAQLGQAPKKPNILVIWGDDIGTWNISHNNRGMMGYRTPNIDRLAKEGVSFTDYYGQQSCTAGRAAFIGGNVPVRTGMTKVGLPGAQEGWQKSDPTIAAILKAQGYATAQFGKNHFGDRDEHLPTMHGFDEYFGSLYHLNASEEPENLDYPKSPEFLKKLPRHQNLWVNCGSGRSAS